MEKSDLSQHISRRYNEDLEKIRGRVLAMGGGGYNRRNLARAWTRVVEALVAS